VSYHAPSGHYAADAKYFTSAGRDSGPLHAPQSGTAAGNGLYAYGAGTVFPQSSYQDTNYWVDAVFTTAAPTDTTAPTVLSTSPADGATGVPTTSTVQFTFSEAVQPATARVTVTTAQGATVAGTVTASSDRVLVFSPTTGLPAGSTLTATVSGVKDVAGNTLTAARGVTFTTAAAGSSGCPCTLFDSGSGSSATAADDGYPVELGLRFASDTAGSVTGVRFYKATGDTGTHTGSLWAGDGTRLATATFTGETASGWQQVLFSTPVAIQAGTTYTVSYHGTAGRYVYTYGGLATAGVDRGPLHAPVGTATAPNGAYAYGASAFPSQGNTSNYWVDVVLTTTGGTGTGGSTGGTPSDTKAPTVASVSPAAGATAVPVTSPVTVTFSEPVVAGSLVLSLTGPGGGVSGTVALDASGTKATLTPAAKLAGQTTYTVSARATDTSGNAMAAPVTSTFTTADVTAPTVGSVTPTTGSTGVSSSASPTATFSEAVVASSVQAVLSGGGATVPTTASWSADARTLTLKPGAVLSGNTQYTVTLSGARDAAGNTQAAAYAWSFTTASPPTSSLFTASDSPPATAVASTAATELGMRVTFTQAGWVTGVRFYKSSGGTGQHIGSLWSTSGQRLAAVQFVNETATGWQVAQLSQPVAVTAGTTYVVSYTAPAGRWSQTASYFTAARTTGALTAPANGSSPNGITGSMGTFPASAASGANFWVDVLFTTVPPAGSAKDTVAPVVVATTPSGTGQSTQPAVVALFSESVSGVTMTLTRAGATVASTVGWSSTNLAEMLVPVSPLASRTTYTVTVSGGRDAAGNVMAPVTWTFTTA
jgi:methionine-rich copper-binding protein CopC